MNGLKLEIRNWKLEIRKEKIRSRAVILSDEFCANFNFLISIFSFQRSVNACSGIALIGIIIAIVIMGLLGGSVLMLITTSSMESLQSLQWSKAFFAAESGVSAAKYQMSTNAAWYVKLPWTNKSLIGSASFVSVVATNDGTNVVISSTGTQDESRCTSKWSPAGGELTRAILVYQEGTLVTPRYHTCSNLRRLSTNLTATSVFGASQWQRIEANPQTNEFILVTQNSARRIYAQIYINGTWGSNTYLNAAGPTPAANARGFDVAYESLSGRGMVVYSIGTSNPQYRVWNSNSWSLAQPINVGASNAIIWVKLISRPNTNEIMCLSRWRNTSQNRNYSSAIIWNGTIWTNYIPLERQCNSITNYETMDAAYSANTGLVVYINGATPTAQQSPKYRTYNPISGAWSAENTMATLSSAPRWIRVEYSPDGSLAYAAFAVTTSSRFRGTYWNGSAWGSYNTFGNNSLNITTYRCFDIAWSSQDNTLMVVYSLNQNAQSYLRATGGGSSNQYGSLVSTDDGQWCVLKADPFTPEFYYLAIDDQSDVNLQRWTGSAWTLFPELENGSSLTYLSIDFGFRRDSASANCWPVR